MKKTPFLYGNHVYFHCVDERGTCSIEKDGSNLQVVSDEYLTGVVDLETGIVVDHIVPDDYGVIAWRE